MLSDAARQELMLATGGSYSMARDALKHRVWDTRYFGTTISDHTFFVQQIGSAWNIGTKTLTETNMRDSGKLPNGQVMVITRMGIQCVTYQAIDAATGHQLAQGFIDILTSSVFEVKIEGREWDYQIHGGEFLSTIPVIGNTGATNVGYRLGDSIASGWSNLKPTPIIVDQMVGFSVIHRITQPNTTVLAVLNAACTALNTGASVMRVTLEGLLTRAK